MTMRGFVVATMALGLAVGCGESQRTAGPQLRPIAATDISGTYNLVAKDAKETVVFLGHLHFTSVAGDQVSGSWDLSAWGGDGPIPGLPDQGVLTGTLHGTTLILRSERSDPQSTLGWIAEGFQGERMVGSLTLLPTRGFEGGFEAIRAK
jgi:hypothetical protein